MTLSDRPKEEPTEESRNHEDLLPALLEGLMPEGAWARLDDLEAKTADVLGGELGEYSSLFEATYRVAVILPGLPARRKEDPGVRDAFALYRRCLNDLRCIWLLVSHGYTQQAGSIAAALLEHSFAVTEEAERPGDLTHPWQKGPDASPKVRDLCRGLARRFCRNGALLGIEIPPLKEKELELRYYGCYKLLCQMKHPTVAAARHDATGLIVDGKAKCLASPNLAAADLPLKFEILEIAVDLSLGAIRDFSLAPDIDATTSVVQEFQQLVVSILLEQRRLAKLHEGLPLPFTIGGSKTAEEYRVLTEESG